MIDVPAGLQRRLVAPAPAPTGMAFGEVAQQRAQLLLALVHWRFEPLGGTTLANRHAGSALGHPELLFECDDHSTTAVRGQYFPSATNFNMSMSRAWLATMRLSCVFSFCNSFKSLASFAFMAPY